MAETPCITAVMVTSGDQYRQRLAQVALECFRRQTYPVRRLLILNHGPPILACCDGHRGYDLEEHLVKKPGTLGELRNLAFKYIPAEEYMISWDDDDWYHPTRMQVQFDALDGRQASVLKHYTTVELASGKAFIHSRIGGCLGTILCKVKEFRYPALARHEDSRFANQYLRRKQLVRVVNDPLLYLRSCHETNTSGKKHILRFVSRRALAAEQIARIGEALNDYMKAGAIARNPLA